MVNIILGDNPFLYHARKLTLNFFLIIIFFIFFTRYAVSLLSLNYIILRCNRLYIYPQRWKRTKDFFLTKRGKNNFTICFTSTTTTPLKGSSTLRYCFNSFWRSSTSYKQEKKRFCFTLVSLLLLNKEH